jgi:drug/metabolite transporter (DMT)-like permease
MTATMSQKATLDVRVALAFLSMIILFGVNFVAIRISNRELEPFWGAALRLTLAAFVLLSIAAILKIRMPRGKALLFSIVYGVVTFGINFALLYWALLEVSSTLAAVVYAGIPILTLLLAISTGLERFRWAGLAGGVIAFAGIALIFREQLNTGAPVAFLSATLGGAFCLACGAVLVKKAPKTHPIATTAIGMIIGVLFLLAVAAASKEAFVLPRLFTTWVALGWLILSTGVGTAAYVWVIVRWTASGASYSQVLIPIVTFAIGSTFAGEVLTPVFLLGSALVLVGVYVGALRGRASR